LAIDILKYTLKNYIEPLRNHAEDSEAKQAKSKPLLREGKQKSKYRGIETCQTKNCSEDTFSTRRGSKTRSK
jgi:hypothetical protein